MKKNIKLSTRLLSSFAVLALVVGSLASCAPKENIVEDLDVNTPEELDPTIEEVNYPLEVEELGSGDVKWVETETADGWNLVTNEGGSDIGYSTESGVALVQVEGFAFKDLNRNNLLDEYEDWRLDADTRAGNLADMMTSDEIAGLLIHYSQFSIVPDASDIVEPIDAGVRQVLSFATAFPTDQQAQWNNAMQVKTEAADYGIPMNISTNPRIGKNWPSNLGLAATFSPDLVFEASKAFAKEYRAIGISTLLGPQIDLATEPRWARIDGTFGEDPALSRDLTEASSNGHQSTYDISGNDLGWGKDSVVAMIKHWSGDGAGEGGRESHDFFGKYEVYPGGQFETHLIPFVDGGLQLTGKTKSAQAVMTSYSISFDEDNAYGELVGSGFSEYKLNLLRDTYGFDGVVCTDWGTTAPILEDGTVGGAFGMSTAWGVDGMTAPEMTLKALMAGVDQIGGEQDVNVVKEAYTLGVEKYGQTAMDEKFHASAKRLLRNSFIVGLFENPYVDVEKAVEIIDGDEAFLNGYQALLKTAVLVKNADNTISADNNTEEKATIYIPMIYREAVSGMRGNTPSSATLPVELEIASEYYNVVTDKVSDTLTGPADADGKPTVAYADIIRASKEEIAACDYALVIVDSPMNLTNGVTSKGYDKTTESYIPISLQYGPYTADSDSVRKESISGDIVDREIAGTYGVQVIQEKENRTYFGQSSIIKNVTDLEAIQYATENVSDDAKVVVVVNSVNPTIVSEFEADVDAIIVGFSVNPKVYLDIMTGKTEPSGLLPFQMPANMETVEAQYEDVPRDMEAYVDSEGNTYDFAYGLNWSGVISDERTEKYNVAPLVTPQN